MQESTYDLIIVGGGPAGLTGAIYSSRAMLNVLVIAGNPPGGQLTTTTEVENFPGFPEGIQGPELVAKLRLQAQKFGAKIEDSNVVSVEGDLDAGFTLLLDSKSVVKGKSVIIATGASARWLGLPSEQRLRGRGVSACATCDGFFFKNVDVAVVGGGDAAVEEGIFLTNFASKVHFFIRESEEEMFASKIMQKRARENKKIELHFLTEIKEILGDKKVEGVIIVNNETREEKTMNDIRGVFIAIGHSPNTSFLKGFIDLDEHGNILVREKTFTTKEGVFAAGDVADIRYRQAITASGLGCMAALDAIKLLSSRGLQVKTDAY